MNLIKSIKSFFLTEKPTEENSNKEIKDDIDLTNDIAQIEMHYLESAIQTYTSFIHGGNSDYSESSGGGRELFDVYDKMDGGDCSAVLDIYATSTIVNSTSNMFKPYTLIIQNRNMSKTPKQLLDKFIKYNEEKSGLFKMLHGFVRDGYKYGVSFERMKLEKDKTINKTIISGFESLPTDEVYPLHKDDATVITTYLRKYYEFDYYHESNHLKQSNNQSYQDKSKNREKLAVKYDPSIILSFVNSDRSYDYIGKSILFPAIESWMNLKLSEAKLLIQRITRSAQRIIHTIDTQNKSSTKISEERKLLQQFNKANKVISELNTKFIQNQKSINPDPDIIAFTNNGKGGANIVSSDGDVKSITDIDHWRHQIFTSTIIPQSYITDASLKNASRDAVTEMDKLFEASISKGRTRLEQPLKKFYKTCIDNYYNQQGKSDEFEIEIRWSPVSNIEELRREKILQIRAMVSKILRLDLDLPDEFIQSRILKLTDKDVDWIKKLPKPDPISLQNKTRDDKGQNTTSPNTAKNPKAKKEELNQILKDMVEFLNTNKTILEIEELEEYANMIIEVMEHE